MMSGGAPPRSDKPRGDGYGENNARYYAPPGPFGSLLHLFDIAAAGFGDGRKPFATNQAFIVRDPHATDWGLLRGGRVLVAKPSGTGAGEGSSKVRELLARRIKDAAKRKAQTEAQAKLDVAAWQSDTVSSPEHTLPGPLDGDLLLEGSLCLHSSQF